jgi:hypothetical protein
MANSPTPLPSRVLFKSEPAKHAEMKYKMKLMTIKGAVMPRPIPNAIVSSFERLERTLRQDWIAVGQVRTAISLEAEGMSDRLD